MRQVFAKKTKKSAVKTTLFNTFYQQNYLQNSRYTLIFIPEYFSSHFISAYC